jgi:hypothetical protein
MATKSYYELLQDPRWQRKRLEVMQAADFKCERCEAGDKTLNVHHKIYRKGANPWEYQISELMCLCRNCHNEHHGWSEKLKELIANLDASNLEELVGYAEGLRAREVVFDNMDQDEKIYDAKCSQLLCEILSYSHGRGFWVCLTGRMTFEQGEALLAASPINHVGVFGISVDGELPGFRLEGS